MNEYNHHRIIARFAAEIKQTVKDVGLVEKIKQTFKEASDFSDNATDAKGKYYFYSFFYNVEVDRNNKNKIKLNRISNNGYFVNNTINVMENCGEKEIEKVESIQAFKYNLKEWFTWTDEKEFFSSVNGRKKSGHWHGDDKYDLSNQSDNVAFLHAMGSSDDKDEAISKDVFIKHLRKCFSEYLFLENEDEAFFMMGVAMHGIMDSFTPSHMGFRKYSEQDHDLHAQGDVIPIKGVFDGEELISCAEDDYEPMYFDPGQDEKCHWRNEVLRVLGIIHFDKGDYINLEEYYMLRVFFYVGAISFWNEGKKCPLDSEQIESLWGKMRDERKRTKTKKEINDIILHGRYCYGEEAYIYSESAINVMVDVFNDLFEKRKEVFSEKPGQRYIKYLEIKDDAVSGAIERWTEVYDGKKMSKVREEHLKKKLYEEVEEVKKWREERKKAINNQMYTVHSIMI